MIRINGWTPSKKKNMWMRSSRVVERLTANAKVATVLGSITASSDTVESEGRPGFRIRIRWIRINLSCWIRIRIRIQIVDPDPAPGGQKWPTKIEKTSRIFMFLSTGCSLSRAEGFSCSLGVLYGGLGISRLQFLIKKIEIKFPAMNFFQF